MTAKVFARTSATGLEFLSTTFDATDSDDMRPGMDPDALPGDGWLPVVRVDRPDPEPGYVANFGGWVLSANAVSESWEIAQRPQPYPSCPWVEGEGWQPPAPMPADGGPWSWDESTLSWVEVTP